MEEEEAGDDDLDDEREPFGGSGSRGGSGTGAGAVGRGAALGGERGYLKHRKLA